MNTFIREIYERGKTVAAKPGQVIDVLRSLFEYFVFLQPPHQFRTRVFLILVLLRARQQHPGFYLRQHGRHDQVLPGQLQLQHLHQFNVSHVLFGDPGDGYVEDVQVLALDEIQQQVEGAGKGLQEHLQRVRRDIKVLGDLAQGNALHYGKRHFLLQRAALRELSHNPAPWLRAPRSGFPGQYPAPSHNLR